MATGLEIFIEAASESPKVASIILDARRIQLESASADAVQRLRDRVGMNEYKQPASKINEVVDTAGVELGKNSAETEIEGMFRAESAAPDNGMQAAQAEQTTVPVDEVDENGINLNPSEQSIDEFCDFLAGI